MTSPPEASGDRRAGETRTSLAPEADARFQVALRGVEVDHQTRCAHWNGQSDVVALRFACCDAFYPCRACHDEAADHTAEVWPLALFDEPAVLCGVCRETLTARVYLGSGDACPSCRAPFNPGCRSHRDLYFETPEASGGRA